MGISYTQKLKATFEDLTYSEEKLAEYIDAHRSEIGGITSQQLGGSVGDRTVHRDPFLSEAGVWEL